jgi:hypothetical protein
MACELGVLQLRSSAPSPQSTLKALRKNNIDIVALHQHMTHEEPRIIFFHYWGRGAAKLLAENVKAALALIAAK